MGTRVLKKERGHPEFAPPACHRRGWMRIGKSVTVWCVSCGPIFKGDAKESEVEAMWREHVK